MKKIWANLKNDPFVRVSLSWALGVTGIIMVIGWIELQLAENFDPRLYELIPFLVTLFGAAYMVKFVGRKPVLYTALCGVFVAIFMAFLGLIGDLLNNGLSWQAFVVFVLVAAFRSLGMALVGALGGWIMTRGRVPIEIEIPGKKEVEAARREGLEEPAPRIVTPLAAMPGALDTNTSMLEQLNRDPESLLPENEKRRRAKNAARNAKIRP